MLNVDLPGEINKLQEASPSSEEAAQKIKTDIVKKQEVLDKAAADLKKWNKETFNKLSDKKLQKYADAFNVKVEDLKTMTVHEA